MHVYWVSLLLAEALYSLNSSNCVWFSTTNRSNWKRLLRTPFVHVLFFSGSTVRKKFDVVDISNYMWSSHFTLYSLLFIPQLFLVDCLYWVLSRAYECLCEREHTHAANSIWLYGICHFILSFWCLWFFTLCLFDLSPSLSLFVTFSIFLMVIWVKKCTLSDTYSQL